MYFRAFTLLFPFLGLSLASPIPTDGNANLANRETVLNAFLADLLEYVPDIDGTLDDVVGVLTDFEDLLADVTGAQTTYNELSSTCTEYTVIFARGTTEPGNVGVLVGPPFFDALDSAIGDSSKLTIQGVNNYSATILGYAEGGDPVGSAKMASQIEQAYSLCPSTKLTISGYSQGAQIVHNAAALIDSTIASWISSVVVFGDPDNGTAIANIAASKVDTYCNTGDNICVDGDLILPAHLLYGEDATAAAAFVVAAA
jgi:hypothetical protein